MATAVPSADESVFDAMTEQIIAVFDRIMREVKSRRDQLIFEVDKKRKEFESKNSAVRELETMRSQMEKMSFKEALSVEKLLKSLSVEKLLKSLSELDSEIAKLKTDMLSYNQLKYSCSLDQLIGQVKQFGEIIDEASNFTSAKSKNSSKLTATKVIGGLEASELDSTTRLHVYPYGQLLFVTYSGKNTVLVYNAANDFKYLTAFGGEGLRYGPKCVATSKELIYVGDDRNLLRYKSSNFSFLNKIEISTIHSIAVSSDNQVFVLTENGYLSVYDRALNFIEKRDLLNIKKKYTFFCYYSLRMVFEDKLYILDDLRALLVFDYYYNKSNSYFDKEGNKSIVKCPSAFCIDQAGNIIVADSTTNSIKFLSPEGELIHTIGEETVGSDNIPNCSDIAVYKNNVFVVCKDPKAKHYNIRVY